VPIVWVCMDFASSRRSFPSSCGTRPQVRPCIAGSAGAGGPAPSRPLPFTPGRLVTAHFPPLRIQVGRRGELGTRGIWPAASAMGHSRPHFGRGLPCPEITVSAFFPPHPQGASTGRLTFSVAWWAREPRPRGPRATETSERGDHGPRGPRSVGTSGNGDQGLPETAGSECAPDSERPARSRQGAAGSPPSARPPVTAPGAEAGRAEAGSREQKDSLGLQKAKPFPDWCQSASPTLGRAWIRRCAGRGYTYTRAVGPRGSPGKGGASGGGGGERDGDVDVVLPGRPGLGR
jgi:hypothetical protein